MIKDTCKVLYIILVFCLTSIIPPMRFYDIGEPSFFVPVIIIALIIGVMGVYLFAKDMKLYKNLHFLSYVITIGIVFVPVIGVFTEGDDRFYGFPAQWFSYYPISGSVSLQPLGFLFNCFIFYLIFRLLNKILASSSSTILN